MLMNKSGKIIWLRARPETIEARMLQDKNSLEFRPALTVNDNISEIEEILHSREPLYRSATAFSVDTDDHDIQEVVNIVVKKLKTINHKK